MRITKKHDKDIFVWQPGFNGVSYVFFFFLWLWWYLDFFSLGEAFFGYKTQHVPINQVPEASRVRWELERTFRFQKSADERGLNAAQWLISKHVFSRHFGDQTFPLTKGVTSLPMIYTIQNRNQSEDTSTIGCSEPSHGRTSGKWMQMPWATVWH